MILWDSQVNTCAELSSYFSGLERRPTASIWLFFFYFWTWPFLSFFFFFFHCSNLWKASGFRTKTRVFPVYTHFVALRMRRRLCKNSLEYWALVPGPLNKKPRDGSHKSKYSSAWNLAGGSPFFRFNWHSRFSTFVTGWVFSMVQPIDRIYVIQMKRPCENT